jgi:hypothetical protein
MIGIPPNSCQAEIRVTRERQEAFEMGLLHVEKRVYARVGKRGNRIGSGLDI